MPANQPATFDEPRFVREVLDLYLLHAKNEICAQTYEQRTLKFAEFSAVYGSLPIAKAKPHHLLLWVNSHGCWPSDWTKSGIIAGFIRAFSWAKRLGIIEHNPFAGTPRPAGERREAMEPAHYQALLRHSSPAFRRLVVFLRYTGARGGEAISATWEDFHAERCCIQLTQHKTMKKSKGKPRVIMLPAVALKLLAWIKRRDAIDPNRKLIFQNTWGKPWIKPAIAWNVKAALQRAGIKGQVTLHQLRHLFGTQAVIRGVDIVTLAELMGHSKTAQTEHYLHVAGRKEHLKTAVDKIFKPTKDSGQ